MVFLQTGMLKQSQRKREGTSEPRPRLCLRHLVNYFILHAMNLTQQRIDGLIAQLAMAQAKHPPSAIQIALLRAQIKELQAKVGK